ncbi:hypothetical protein H0N98_01035 [Candidatus Micrarchaeota archaeon]|nr:hypothetical protein [Candidatus Micrarchaeota archaeon]
MAFLDILKPEMLRLILFSFIFIMLDLYINPSYRHDEVLGGSYYSCTEYQGGSFECIRTAEVPPPPFGISFGLESASAHLFWSYVIRVLSVFLAYFVSSLIVWGLCKSVGIGI